MNAPVHPIHIQRRDATPVAASCGHAHVERWSVEQIEALFDLPFNDLILRAQAVHREHFAPNQVELATLLSIKTGGCPEDCGYCPQSVHYDTGVDATKLMDVEAVAAAARLAKEHGATRFCMGAAWRAPKDRDIEAVSAIVREVKSLGLEACCPLGMLTEPQAKSLKDAGLDYYNHNLDTAPEAYGRVISTRDYQDRLDTLGHVREAGISVCCGGIVGMGESPQDRIGLIHALATLPVHPESVPINLLVGEDTRAVESSAKLDPLDF